MISLVETLSLVLGLLSFAVALAFRLGTGWEQLQRRRGEFVRRGSERFAERSGFFPTLRAWLVAANPPRWLNPGRSDAHFRIRLPSLSGGLLKLAERRLPRELSEPDRERWAAEMRADVASLPRWRRLKVAFNAWRKGAPNIPTGAANAPRSARD